MEPDAEQALRREAVIDGDRRGRADRARPSEELLEALEPTAEREGVEPQKLLDELRAGGRLEELREDLAARQAIDLIAEQRAADPARAGAGARAAVDARAGERAPSAPAQQARRRRAAELWTPTDRGCGQLASERNPAGEAKQKRGP